MRDEKLEHYGVPGMKWGKRTKRQTQTIPKNRKRTIKEGGKLHKSNLKTFDSMRKKLDTLSPERKAQYEQALKNIKTDMKMVNTNPELGVVVLATLLGGVTLGIPTAVGASAVSTARIRKVGEASAGRELDKLNE